MIDKVEEGRELSPVVSSGKSGAMSVYNRIADPIRAVKELGEFYHQSGMLGVKTPGGGAVLALHCMCEGITPIQFKRKYHIMFDGTVSMKYDAMLADFRARGGEYKQVSRTPELASIYLSCEGVEGTYSMTIEEARAEKYFYQKDGKTPKDNYSTPRRCMQMMWARVVSDGIKVVCPEVGGGSYTPEEAMEFEGNVNVVDVAYTSRTEPVSSNNGNSGEDIQPAGTVQEAAVTEPETTTEQPCTTDQLVEIVKWGEALGQSKEQVADALTVTHKIAKPQDLTFSQAREAIEKMQNLHEKVRPEKEQSASQVA